MVLALPPQNSPVRLRGAPLAAFPLNGSWCDTLEPTLPPGNFTSEHKAGSLEVLAYSSLNCNHRG